MIKTRVTAGICVVLLATCMKTQAEPTEHYASWNQPIQSTQAKTHVWSDGTHYEGDWKAGQPHGFGTMVYANGATYWGQFDHGRRSGQGIMRYNSGDEYEGSWLNDQPHGKGSWRYNNGDVYSGDFQAGKKTGQGKQLFLDGTYYQGSWSNDEPNGEGELTFISGGIYQGTLKHGRPHGHGRYQYPNGNVYTGNWVAGNQDGKGHIAYATGGYYEGEFVEGMRHGKGTQVSALGSVYTGAFRDNEAHGEGICNDGATLRECEYRRNQLLTPPATIAAAPPTAAIKKTSKPQSETPPRTIAKADDKKLAKAKPQPTPQRSPEPEPEPEPSKETEFVAALQQEKTQLHHLTVEELRRDRSDIYFNENWAQKDLMAIPERAWWQKQTSLFSDSLQIVSIHGDTEIRMVVSNYEGPGSYDLKRIRVYSPADNMDAEIIQSGTIVVQTEGKDWITGTFQFAVSDENGQQLSFDHGAFRLTSRESITYIER